MAETVNPTTVLNKSRVDFFMRNCEVGVHCCAKLRRVHACDVQTAEVAVMGRVHACNVLPIRMGTNQLPISMGTKHQSANRGSCCDGTRSCGHGARRKRGGPGVLCRRTSQAGKWGYSGYRYYGYFRRFFPRFLSKYTIDA